MSNKSLSIRWLIGMSLFTALTGLLFTTCKKQGISIPPAVSEFATSHAAYYIQDDPKSIYHIPVGVTSISTKPRNITFKVVSSTATEGQQYAFTGTKGTVTIPADSAIGFLDIKGIYAGYASTPGRIDTLVLALTGGDIPLAHFTDTFTLIMKQYCPVVLADLLGQYNNCSDIYKNVAYGPYTVTVTGTSTGPTSARLVIVDLVYEIFGPYSPGDHAGNPGTTVNIDWSDPGNFKANIPAQGFYIDPTYGPTQIAGGGTFSSCDNTFNLTYSVSISTGQTFGGLGGTILAR